MISSQESILGCLLGGAVGDALGAPIEFMNWETIKSKFGDRGINDYVEYYNRLGAITDDTQMTLFTAEGLIRAQIRYERKGICSPSSIVKHAYKRWMLTQGIQVEDKDNIYNTGWLISNKVLHHRRAPGNTVIKELSRSNSRFADNDRKGCGGVMRVAPVGLMAIDPFGLAADIAHITHGHPTGYLSSGTFAMIISEIMYGKSLSDAIDKALIVLKYYDGHQETLEAILRAKDYASNYSLTTENIEKLGGGWVAEESLAIAVFCALKAVDFSTGILAAVNHSGDSDSTGSICGNILGCSMGSGAIPNQWIENLEAREVIEQLSKDFIDTFINNNIDAVSETKRYPPY